MIEFTVYGEPVAQGRPRASTRNGQVRMYDPIKSRDFKQYVKLVASQHKPTKLLEGPLSLEVIVYKPSLKKFSKKKKVAAEQGKLRPITKPDVDNYVKGVKDALNKVIWNDDSQVVDLKVSKFYSEEPRVEIKVEEWTSPQNNNVELTHKASVKR
ncbi:RusA family crossover junction endodeoxyribonuclease (plasmid) [Bacillus carboniphilus]|uniref:RusA family crossover junction endodeoxyribonuclease n=1 Tax=Bacillus carboniphilus TaxID=86663 RepID=A0ABY9JYQ7_9BACI|nr:RusA family crossover junction endodeoxyribonuclease [Bacillus carboniphilus]WLR44526.1 RusA family crossover junction endodeoxyribonuclease [Bacillus carboniphilus]